MKKNRILFTSALAITCLAVASLQSCSKLAKNLQYDLDMQTASVDVVLPPSSDTVGTASGSQTANYNVDSFIKANTANVLGISNITSVKIKSVTLTLTNATVDQNFANFKSCYGSVYSNSNTTPYVLSVPSNPDVFASTLALPVDTSSDLRNYMTGTNFTYTLGGSLRRATHDSVRCTVQFAFKVHVQG